VDGHRFDPEKGRFEASGAGPHVVILGAAGRLGDAWRILLADGECRSLTFGLPPC
jgi:hypothetical protein